MATTASGGEDGDVQASVPVPVLVPVPR